ALGMRNAFRTPTTPSPLILPGCSLQHVRDTHPSSIGTRLADTPTGPRPPGHASESVGDGHLRREKCMNRKDAIRIPARLLLWLGGLVCGLGIQGRAPWAVTIAFLATLSALLALSFCDQLRLDAARDEEIPLLQ